MRSGASVRGSLILRSLLKLRNAAGQIGDLRLKLIESRKDRVSGCPVDLRRRRLIALPDTCALAVKNFQESFPLQDVDRASDRHPRNLENIVCERRLRGEIGARRVGVVKDAFPQFTRNLKVRRAAVRLAGSHAGSLAD